MATILEDVYKSLEMISKSVIEAESEFYIYCSILKLRSNQKGLQLYNEYIYTLHHLTNATLYSFLVKICKTTDPAESRRGRDKNATFDYLKDELFDLGNQKEKRKISSLEKRIKKLLPSIQEIRNKHIAHLDRFTDETIIKTVHFKQISNILNLMLDLANVYKFICHKKMYHKYIFNSHNIKKELDNIIPIFESK